MITQLSHWPYVKVPCLGISQVMRSVVALESRRAQAFASSMTMSATVSVPIICANELAFSSQGGTASCFFLARRSVGDVFWMVFGKGESMGFMYLYLLFPTHLIFPVSLNSRGVALSKSPLSLWSWTGLLLWRPACSCWSFWVPRKCLKIQCQTFHIPHQEIDVPPYWI